MTTTLVFEVLTDHPGRDVQAGDFIICEPGAVPPECDVLLVRGLPRGRLGWLLGAANDGSMRLCDPPASSECPAELLSRLLQPVSPG